MLKLSALSTAFALILTACTLTPPSADKPTAVNTPPAGCVAQTATRIQVKDTACAGPGNTYTKQDIERTGQANLGDALPMLDPAISKH